MSKKKHHLKIENLHVSTADGKEILKGINLTVRSGEVHAIMGPNGSGKSTLAQVILGNPGYIVNRGNILLDGNSVIDKPTHERARMGLFLAFQYPIEIPGVNFLGFLRLALNEVTGKKRRVSPIEFRQDLLKEATKLAFREDITKRSLNEGFSGGEKKKSEILQLAILKPTFALLDEPDSGLDIDALRYISKTLSSLNYPVGILLITHYQRILNYIRPDKVHVLVGGKVVQSGDAGLAKKIEKEGYEKITKQLSNIQ